MVCTSVQKNSPICIFCHSALLKWLSPERLVSRMKVRVCLHEGYGVCGEKLTFVPVGSQETQASQIIPDYTSFNTRATKAVLSTRLSEKHSFFPLFFLFSPCNVSGSPFPGCWQERDSDKFLSVRCLVSPMKIPFWHTSRKVIHGALCQHGWLQQKQYPFECLRNLWFKALSYNHI